MFHSLPNVLENKKKIKKNIILFTLVRSQWEGGEVKMKSGYTFLLFIWKPSLTNIRVFKKYIYYTEDNMYSLRSKVKEYICLSDKRLQT